MLSCHCNIKESENKNWICLSSIPPYKCPHNTFNTSKAFSFNKKNAIFLKKYNITLGIILLFTPLFPFAIYFFISAVLIKYDKKKSL